MLAGDSAGGTFTLGVGMKMAKLWKLNLETEDCISKPFMLAPIYPTVQAINYNTKSFLNKSLPSLERDAVINYTLAYALPNEKTTPEMIESVNARAHFKWFTKEEKTRTFPI